MKKLCLILVTFVLSMNTLHAQSNSNRWNEERENIRRFLNYAAGDGSPFLEERASKLYEAIEQSPYKICHMSTMSVGRWSTPDGIERMNGVILYNKTSNQMLKRQKVFIVYISLDVWIDDCLFWNNLPVDNWMEGIREHTKDMRVMDIRFEERTLFTDPEPELKIE